MIVGLSVRGPHLFFESTHEGDERFDLRVRELLAEGRHLAAPVRNRVVEALVRDALLPGGVRQVARAVELRLESFGPAVLAVTRRALVLEEGRRLALLLHRACPH